MAAMEEKLLAMAVNPDAITEKEEMLQVASNRVDALKQELTGKWDFRLSATEICLIYI